MEFSIVISNTDTGSSIAVTSESGYSDWRIPSDGLNGFGSMPFSTAQEEFAVESGGVLLGGHINTRQLILKLEAPSTAEKREEAYKVFAVGSTVTVSTAYNRNTARTISGIVTACKMSEGNIYEPTAVTATIECQNPLFRGEDIAKTAYSYTTGSGVAKFSWRLDVQGDSLATLKAFTMTYTTKNTEAITLSRQALVRLYINRAVYKPYSLPQRTVYAWNAGPAKGETVAASTPVEWTVKLDKQLPYCLYNDISYGMESAVLTSWEGLGVHEVLPISTTAYTASLRIDMDSAVTPTIMSYSNGKMTYMPGWQGV